MIASVRMFTALTMILTAASAGATPYFNPSACDEPNQRFQPIQRTHPAYPHSAALVCLEGSVHLQFTIDEHGHVVNIRIADSQPPGVFDRAAIRAAESWLYRPACKNGEPVSSEASTAIDFVLERAVQQNCPDNPPELDDTMLDLLAEIVSFYLMYAEARSNATGHEDLQSMLIDASVPELDDTSFMVWSFHHNALLDSLALIQQGSRELAESGLPGLLFASSTYESDPDMVQTRVALDEYGHALDRHIDRLEVFRAELEASYAELEHATGLDEDLLSLLVIRFLGDFRQGSLPAQEHIESLKAQYALMQAAVELLERELGRWQIDANGSEFDDPEAGDEFGRIISHLYASLNSRRQARLDWQDMMRGFEDYFDAD